MSGIDVTEGLEALEERWRPHGGREGMRLRPGLTDAELDAVVAPIGYRLDDEQRAWWRWADGTEGTATDSVDAGQVFPGTCLMPLGAAVRAYRRWSAYNTPELKLWPAHWLPLTNGQFPLVSGATGTDRTEVSVWRPEDQPGRPHLSVPGAPAGRVALVLGPQQYPSGRGRAGVGGNLARGASRTRTRPTKQPCSWGDKAAKGVCNGLG